MFDFLRRKKDEVPDVGKEEEPEAEAPEEEQEEPEEEEEAPRGKKGKKGKAGKKSSEESGDNFQVEKIKAKLEIFDSLIKGYSERFSQLSQQIGEVRAMAVSNEKIFSKTVLESEKMADILKEVKPDKIRIDVQKTDMRIDEVNERIAADQQFQETIMNELKDLRRKAGIFVGTDALIKLNEDVKKDLIELQRVAGKVKMNADKSEELFVELKRQYAETQKVNEIASEIDSNYSGLKKEVEKLKIDYSKIVSDDDFSDFKKSVNNRLGLFSKSIIEIDKARMENERLAELIETTLSISKKNKDDIAEVAMALGDNNVKSVSDYENQIESILKILDSLAAQITSLKKKSGMRGGKIEIRHDDRKIMGKSEAHMRHIHMHKKMARKLALKHEKHVRHEKKPAVKHAGHEAHEKKKKANNLN